ncbi:MAG TPA: alpha/beta hydrolase [Vicinamibacterales bacterium]|nr:alpha/beta hydrolase [Vicinamibacterales bacterium]
MKKTNTLCMAALLMLCSRAVLAQDLSGDWQGALSIGTQQLRLILHIDKADDASWKATLASIDQSPDRGARMPADAVTVAGTSFKMTVAAIRGSFDGTIASDGNSIAGTWTQGAPLPLTLTRATPATAWKDPSPHTASFVTSERDVKLEVLDWGGPSTGRTLVLVPGLGNTAHIFDVLATKLTARYHVIGVTRRGFGDSSAPASGYGADRLGDDVLAVIDALKISKPVLAGHSLGGEELSSIGSRYPERVAGLIYLDAGYSYAFYAPDIEPFPAPPTTSLPPIMQGIMSGRQNYTRIPVPILAIYALPHDPGAAAPAAVRAQTEANDVKAEAQAKAFEAGLPTARVVRIPRANHYVFVSNEADVLREMETFMTSLK